MEYRQHSRSWGAAVVGTAIVGIAAHSCVRRMQTVDDSLRFAIGVSLTREYQGTGFKQQMQEYLKSKAGGNALSEPPPSTTPIPTVDLVSVRAHGLTNALVARVEVMVNGGPPVDGRNVRYLQLMRSVDGRRLVVADSDSVNYMMNLLPLAMAKADR